MDSNVNPNRYHSSGNVSIQIKRICIQNVLPFHTMETNPYISKPGSKTV